jgi:benzoylformate decarboxylase
MPSIREMVWDELHASTAPVLFGNPGTTEVPFLHGIPDGMRYVMVPHEAAAVAMADGYAQFSDRPVAVSLHSVAGVANALSSVVTASRNNTPLLLIAGQQSRDLLPFDPYLAAGDLPAMVREHTRYAVHPQRPEDVPVCINQALRHALAPPGGPVLVVVPADDWDHEASAMALPRPRRSTLPLDPGDAETVAQLLNDADSPALVLGAGVARTGSAAAAVPLAERLAAPAWTAPMTARNTFPEHHPLFAGHLPAQPDELHKQLAGHDVVLIVGAQAFTFHHAGSRSPAEMDWPALLHIDDDPPSLDRSLAGTTVLASPASAIRALIPHLTQRAVRRGPARVLPPPLIAAEDTRLNQTTAIAALGPLLPDNALIVEEAPTARPLIHAHLPIRHPHQDFLTMSSGILGFGLPAAVGAALASPDRPVVAIIGDGSFMYSPQALHTAAALGLDNLTVLVLDNGGYGAVRRHADRLTVAVPGTDMAGLAFDSIALGHGINDIHLVYHLADLRGCLPEALNHDGPSLLWVDLARTIRPAAGTP